MSNIKLYFKRSFFIRNPIRGILKSLATLLALVGRRAQIVSKFMFGNVMALETTFAGCKPEPAGKTKVLQVKCFCPCISEFVSYFEF